MHDLLIRGGVMIDGTGAPMIRADVAVRDGRVVSVGDLSMEHAHTEIDASGLFVAPGFIDLNNRSDVYWRLFRTPGMESMVAQGVTTIIGGNAGSSLAPLIGSDFLLSIRKWTTIDGANVNWRTMKEFLDQISDHPLALNFGTLVGHTTLRRAFVGDEQRALTSDELRSAEKILANALKEGALGLSTGLVYSHARDATAEELSSFIKVIKRFNAFYATYVRDETESLPQAVEEVLALARSSRARVHISHFKAVGERYWPKFIEALSLIEAARADGVLATFDIYPYTFTGSVLYLFLPKWVTDGGRRMMLERLRDRNTRARVIADLRTARLPLARAVVSASPLSKTLAQPTIAAIARTRHQSVEEAIIDLLLASDGQVIVLLDALSERNVMRGIQHPFSLIGSNGAGYTSAHRNSGEVVHPRSFGAFPRVFGQYVRKRQILSWEEAIAKMTGRVANVVGITDRGTIAPKKWADLVVFNPHTIEDCATVDNPYVYPRGIIHVLVNGTMVVRDGAFTGERHGMVVRRA